MTAAASSVTTIDTTPWNKIASDRTRTPPATTALRPSSAAMLYRFEPSTTPTPTELAPLASAAIAVAISGESEASAADCPPGLPGA